jgi:hypothetical protein
MTNSRLGLLGFLATGVLAAADPSVGIEHTNETALERAEEILIPGRIRHEEGFGYTAGLTGGRSGDKDGTSICTLLENGKPLPHPRARHATIRNIGQGHYSHWTVGTLYFSASDNTDPRTNGRRYALVSEQQTINHTSRVRVTQSKASYQIPAGTNRSLSNRRLIIRNVDENTAIIPRLSVDGWPDLTSSEGILASILKPGMSAEEKSLAIWKFLVNWRFHHYPAEQGNEVHDPVRFINVYGYGFCDDSARNTAALAQLAGLRSRVWGLSGHVVAETFYEGGWHMFDPDHEVYYRNSAGHIASVEELARNPQLITKTERDPIGSDSRAIARLYTTTNDNSVRENKIPATHKLRPVLQPGDELVFDFRNHGKIHRTTFTDRPLPPSFGNGTLTRKLDLSERESTVSIEWPYVVLDAELNWPANGSEPAPKFEVSVNGKTFEEIPLTERGGMNAVRLTDWFKSKGKAIYRFQLRITRDSAGSSLHQIPLKLDFQFTTRAVARVQPNGTRFAIHTETAIGRPLPTTWRGLEIIHEWQEPKPR